MINRGGGKMVVGKGERNKRRKQISKIMIGKKTILREKLENHT